ncbi:MAG: hypothetical protein KDK24_16915 [Pseudooceanicola sp.]|nr:hypothetical protein [Pseudooceanicola sp.]
MFGATSTVTFLSAGPHIGRRNHMLRDVRRDLLQDRHERGAGILLALMTADLARDLRTDATDKDR